METQLSKTANNPKQENGGTEHHVIAIPPDDHEWLVSMEQKMKETPKLLNKSAGRTSCCIFRVPQSLVEINRRAYEPHVVSIGPYHHGKEHLMMIQEHKWRFLDDVIDRSQKHGIGIGDLFKTIAPMDERIRESYSESIECSKKELVEMMVLDGCFIIELFCFVGGYLKADLDDPVFNMSWMLYFLMRDLLRLENQIPFFILQTLFGLTILPSSKGNAPSLTELALGFFDYAIERPGEVLHKHKSLSGKHLLDLFRLTLVPPAEEMPRKNSQFLQLIPSAKKLHQAGIRFKPREADSNLHIKFHKGVLEIPPLTVDDSTSSFLLNCVAFEQCYNHCPKHITSYITFMGCLINSPTDAGFLSDHRIIENYLGTDGEATRFFSNLGNDVAFDINRSYLAELFEDVNEHCRNNWHVRWASFKDTYFNTPWSFISALAAAVLLILTMIQAIFAVYSYFRPPK